jgi:branched-chain amino acid transport system ATP-binding protein
MSDAPLLELEDVHAFYGSAHILEGVSFSMGLEAVALIGRNGMGKSTLCNTIMGLCDDVRGSIRVAGVELRGKAPYMVAAAGWATCRRGAGCSRPPVDEHLRMIRPPGKGRWTREIYKLFPRLAERKRISATQLRAASSRCSPSAGRSCSIRTSWSWTSPRRASRRRSWRT